VGATLRISRGIGTRGAAILRLLAVLLCANLVFCAVYAESWSVSANESASGRVSGG